MKAQQFESINYFHTPYRVCHKKCTLLKHFQGTICAKMRMCGAGCCDLTSPLPIGDESISGMEALIASRIQCVMQWKIVTISNVSHSLPPFEAHIHICRCFCRMLEAMKRSHQQRLLLSLRRTLGASYPGSNKI